MKAITHNQRIALAAFATACLATAAVGVQAAETMNDAPALTVHYADLNLDTTAGAARLYVRIRHAAEQVCGDVTARRLEEAAAAKTCVDRAVLAGVRAVNNPKVTKEYNAHIGIADKRIDVAALR